MNASLTIIKSAKSRRYKTPVTSKVRRCEHPQPEAVIDDFGSDYLAARPTVAVTERLIGVLDLQIAVLDNIIESG